MGPSEGVEEGFMDTMPPPGEYDQWLDERLQIITNSMLAFHDQAVRTYHEVLVVKELLLKVLEERKG
jgi:hypothetical protein